MPWEQLTLPLDFGMIEKTERTPMSNYLITASRNVLFQVEVEADNPDEAINKVMNMDNLEDFADYSEPLEIEEVEELELN